MRHALRSKMTHTGSMIQKHKLVLAISLALCVQGCSNAASSEDDGKAQELVDAWKAKYRVCQDGEGPKTRDRACRKARKIASQLEEIGWCYGTEDQAEVDKQWQVCEKNKSIDLGKTDDIALSCSEISAVKSLIVYKKMQNMNLDDEEYNEYSKKLDAFNNFIEFFGKMHQGASEKMGLSTESAKNSAAIHFKSSPFGQVILDEIKNTNSISSDNQSMMVDYFDKQCYAMIFAVGRGMKK